MRRFRVDADTSVYGGCFDEEFAGLPEDQARKIQMRQVAEDPILGPFYRQLASEQESAGKR